MVDDPRDFRRLHPLIENLLTHANPSRYFLKINISEMLNRTQKALELCTLMPRHVDLNPLRREPPKNRAVLLKRLPDIPESSIRFRQFLSHVPQPRRSFY